MNSKIFSANFLFLIFALFYIDSAKAANHKPGCTCGQHDTPSSRLRSDRTSNETPDLSSLGRFGFNFFKLNLFGFSFFGHAKSEDESEDDLPDLVPLSQFQNNNSLTQRESIAAGIGLGAAVPVLYGALSRNVPSLRFFAEVTIVGGLLGQLYHSREELLRAQQTQPASK